MDPKELNSVKITLRHETGHLIVGKALGFPTGDMFIDPAQAGQSVDIQPALRTKDDLIDFIERRVTGLYAGVAAQNLGNKSVNKDAAEKSLVSTATDDFSKIRELLRVLVGSIVPDATRDEYEAELEKTRLRLFNNACTIVEANSALIFEVADFAVRQVLDFEKKNRGKAMRLTKISAEALDSFLSDKVIKCADET